MSVIPKIKVGMPKRREKLNLSFDCSTTANIGSIQPTMCREMVPNEKFTVKVASLVRLSPLVKPTFGRMSMRHYHVYVPYKDIWEPFESMLTGQHYVNDSTSYIPTATPTFSMGQIIQQIIMNYSEVSIYQGYGIAEENAITFDPIGKTLTECNDYITNTLTPAWNALRSNKCFNSTRVFQFEGDGNPSDDSSRGFVNFGGYVFSGRSTDSIVFNPQGNGTNLYPSPAGSALITESGADFITYYGGYTFCFKLRPVAKRFRQIMIGLGYQFSPYDVDVKFNPFKLVAYYKAWFELFRPIREKAFTDTNCYKLIHEWRSSSFNGFDVSANNTWIAFLNDLAHDCYYYLPQDYFSMAQTNVAQPNSDQNFAIESPGMINMDSNLLGSNPDAYNIKAQADKNPGQMPYSSTSVPSLNSGVLSYLPVNPLAVRMAMRLMTFVNKNSVIGRSVRQWLKVHYGVDGGSELDANGVVRVGSSRTNVQISDVMSTAETSEGYLGEYAGKGIGYGDSESFDFEAKYFGVWLTLTVIVPESGYYQGYLLENRHNNRYQYFMPEWDAVGYQVLERGEVIDDYNCDGQSWNPRTGFDRTKGFGLVPRYSHYKVGRNIVNGDLSLVGMYSENAPYTLDRRIPAGALSLNSFELKLDSNNKITNVISVPKVVQPGFVPTIVYDDFRRIDPTDHLGQYNRIFAYQRNDIDHFIINMVFNVDAIAPMKSLTSSFDAVQEGDKTIDVTHS